MEECNSCSIEEITLGETTIGDQVNEYLLAYIVADEEIIYIDDKNLDIVTTQLKTTVQDGMLTIRKGEPFKGQGGFVLVCKIEPFGDLPHERLVGIGDGKVLQGHVCTVYQPGHCFNHYKNGVFSRSFKTPSYGMSTCAYASDTCDTWVAQETVEVFQQKNCQGPSVKKKISAYVCSMP